MFSLCATVNEKKRINDLLLTDKDNIKPFSKFFKDVRSIDPDCERETIEREYIYITQSALTAERWADYIRDGGDRYYIQLRIGDLEHLKPLHDITLPIDAPFWCEFLPPNDWYDNSTFVQVRKSKYTVSDSKEAYKLASQLVAPNFRKTSK